MWSQRLRSPMDLPSGSWRPRKAGDVVQRPESYQCGFQSKSEGLRTGSSEGRRSLMSQFKQVGRERIEASSAFLFYSDPKQIGWGPPHWGRPSALLSPSIQMWICSGSTLTDTLRNHLGTWGFLNLTHKIYHDSRSGMGPEILHS